MGLNNSFKDWNDLKKQILVLQMDFLKHIVTVSSAVLAILIALRGTSSHNNSLFQYSLLLLLICILFGIVSLYLILYQHRKMDKDMKESIAEQIENQTENYRGVFSKHNRLLKICEAICIFSFAFSMIVIVLYAL